MVLKFNRFGSPHQAYNSAVDRTAGSAFARHGGSPRALIDARIEGEAEVSPYNHLTQEYSMAKTVADMTATELRQLVGSVVEEKMMQLLGDPDKGLVLRENVRKRLLRQKRAVSKGERGESLETVVRRLKLM